MTTSLETRLRKLEGAAASARSTGSGRGVRIADLFPDDLATIQGALACGVERLPAGECHELITVLARVVDGVSRITDGVAFAHAIRDPESLDAVIRLAEALLELGAPGSIDRFPRPPRA